MHQLVGRTIYKLLGERRIRIHRYAYFYAYSPQTGDFRELETKMVCHGEKKPNQVFRQDKELYYTGNNGKLMRLKITV